MGDELCNSSVTPRN